MEAWGEVLLGLAVAVGLVGVVVPVLPGLLLVWAAVAFWGVVVGGAAGWTLAVAATVLAVISQVVKYTVPGRQLRRAGVPDRALVVGALVGVVGFFVIPVVGLFVGFAAGVYATERARLHDHRAAWTATGHAVRAAGVSILVELVATLLIAGGWVAGLVLT